LSCEDLFRDYYRDVRRNRFGGESLAVVIRLRRRGRKKRPFYRVVVADERNPRQGRFVEDLGYYDPMKDPAQIQIDAEKALVWLREGARPTETARSLLSKAGILQKFYEQRQAHDNPPNPPLIRGKDETQTAEQSDSEQEEEP
jgi:small subunit ribosomal protein S16